VIGPGENTGTVDDGLDDPVHVVAGLGAEGYQIPQRIGDTAGGRAGATGAGRALLGGRKDRNAAMASIASASVSTHIWALPAAMALSGPPRSSSLISSPRADSITEGPTSARDEFLIITTKWAVDACSAESP